MLERLDSFAEAFKIESLLEKIGSVHGRRGAPDLLTWEREGFNCWQ